MEIEDNENIRIMITREKNNSFWTTDITGLMWKEVKKNKQLEEFLKTEIIEAIEDIEMAEKNEEGKQR